MLGQYLAYASAFLTLIGCKPIENGVFENVEVFYIEKLLNGTRRETSIRIEYDDNLKFYIGTKKLEMLIIEKQFISKLPANSVSDLPTIRNITLSGNEIRETYPGAFRNLPKLEILNLSNNELEEIRNNVFNNLTIKDLYLQNNRIARIAHKAFNNLNLRNLFLENNRITRWNREWFAGSSARFLNMGRNLIDDLPPNSFYSMVKSSNTAGMDIAFNHNQLKRINNNVFNGFTIYNTINLESNAIGHFDTDAFNGVNYINTLNLNNNSISDMNPNLFEKTKVDILMLEDNRLRCLSTDIFKLEELDIDGNPITCACVKIWMDWRGVYSNPSIYHITNLEQECL